MKTLSSSFRDPMGYVFKHEKILYRCIHPSYKVHYDKLMSSGLYHSLSSELLLIPHEEISKDIPLDFKPYKLIKPDFIPFISYPYEWSFSQLKDAALCTLEIAQMALKKGMMLKDASAYNIQFHKGKPIFIDTLSFEVYEEGKPWKAYQQFCKHFLAPLSLMSFIDIRLNQLLQLHLDGIPLDLCSKMLPFKSHINLAVQMHIHLHSKSINAHGSSSKKKGGRFSLHSFNALLDNLYSGIDKLKSKVNETHWANYYEHNILTETYLSHKEEIVKKYLEKAKARSAWDLGANDGRFSRLAAAQSIFCVAFDFDPLSVELNYLNTSKEQQKNILPLRLDLSNPSPGIGWNNKERDSLINRPAPDLIMALALVHHLAISYLIPLTKIASYLAQFKADLLIEFVPKSDPKTQLLIQGRDEQFETYTKQNFELAFAQYYTFDQAIQIKDSGRLLYQMKFKKV